jgi:hypothetical protein
MALNERSAINNMFERETTREKNLEKAMKEAKVKESRCDRYRSIAQSTARSQGQ